MGRMFNDNFDDYYNGKLRGYTLAIENKFYLTPRVSTSEGTYLSLSARYMNKSFDRIEEVYNTNNFVDSVNNYSFYEDEITINRQTLDLMVIFGYELTVKKFVFEFYTGIGARYRNVKHKNLLDPNHEIRIDNDHPSIYNPTIKKGNYWTVAVPMNFKIGYNF